LERLANDVNSFSWHLDHNDVCMFTWYNLAFC